MPIFDINVDVKDDRASQQLSRINRQLNTTEASATRVRGIFRGLFAGFGASIAVRQILSLSNATVAIENRLKLVSSSAEGVNRSFDRLADISRKTRSPLEENVALFQRASQAQSELGASTEEIFKFVEATGTALAIQGGAANTARGALIQLSQAIGATVVRAEEFNSILEGALPLAQAAARGIDEAGGSVAKLRQLVIDGEISSKEFFDAIVSQQAFLAEQFENTSATISQAFTAIRNSAIELFREFNQATEFTTILANAIILVADNLQQLLLGGTVAAGLFAVSVAIKAITTSVIGLTIALVTNPIGLIASAIGLVISLIPVATGLLVAFGDSITINIGGQAVPIINLFKDAWTLIAEAIGLSTVELGTFSETLKAAFTNIDLPGFIKSILVPIAQFKVAFQTVFRELELNFNLFVLALRQMWLEFLNFFVIQFERMVNKVIVKFNEFNRLLPQAFQFDPIPIQRFGEDLNAEISEIERTAIQLTQNFQNEFTGNMDEATAIAIAKVDAFFDGVRQRANARAEDLVFSIPVTVVGPDGDSTTTGGGGGGTKPPPDGGGDKKATFSDVVAEYEKGIQALQRLGQEQRVYNEVLAAADKIGRDLTATEAAQIGELVKKTGVLQKASDIYDQLNARVDDYILTQQALNDLLSRGAISQTEADFALGQSQLVQDLAGVDESLGGQFQFEAQLQGIRDYVNERTIILQQAREQDLINEQDYQARLTALTQTSQREILNLELDRWGLAISSAQQSIGVLLGAAKEYAGKQSGIYKGLFIAQKAFAIAEATVNTFRAISNALAAPFPPPIPQTLAAAAAVAGGAQVAAIVASTITGLKDGGRVSGPGGPRDDAAGLFALSNGEFVVNEAATRANLPLLQAINRGMKPLQGVRDGGLISARTSLSNVGTPDVTAASRSAPTAANVNNDVQVPVNVINVSSREEALASIGSQEGGELIINQISENSRQIRNVLGLEN